MKLICTQNNFRKAVFNTERVVGKQNSLPILKNIMLKTEKGRLKFSATNLEIGIITKIGAKIKEKGEITIPAKLLSDFVNNLPNDEEKVLLEAKNQSLSIISGNYKAHIKGLDAVDFPIIPKLKGEYLFSLPAQEIKSTVSKILFCVAINENRPEFSGVNINFLENKVILAATDSFRLAEISLKLNSGASDNYRDFINKKDSVIVPYNTFSEIARAIGEETKKINIAIEENQIFFEIDGVQIVSRLINGKYPDYKQIIPKKFNTRAVLTKEYFLRAVRISSVFTNSQSGEVNFILDSKKNSLVIQAQSHESGENKSKLKADIIGPSQEIILNSRYVMDGISAIPSINIAVLVNDESSPIGFRAVNNESGKIEENYIYIVMPIKK